MTKRPPMVRVLIAPLMLSLLVAGCSSKSSNPTSGGPGGTPADMNTYLAALPSWETFSGKQDSATASAGATVAEISNFVLCTSAPFDITRNPDEIVTFGQRPDVLYLGSLVQGNSYLGGLGTMEELPIRQRAPLTIAINLFSGTPITTVVNAPDAASIQAALNDMVATAAASGIQSGSNIIYQQEESYSSEQAALSLNVSYKYMGSSGKGALAFQTSDQTRTVTAFFKQIMFEAYIVPPQTPGQFFSADFTQQNLDEQVALGNIGPNNLPVYVARIQYGRMLMYSMTYSASAQRLQAAVDASYNGLASVDASIRAEVESILQNASVKVATIGGDANTVLNLIKTGDLKSYFTTNDPLTTAKPLAYALNNLSDGTLAQVSETTKYDVRQCSTADAQVYLNETEWENAVNALVPNNRTAYTFLTYPGGLTFFNEVTTAPNPAVQSVVGQILTFDRTRWPAYAWPFSFYLGSGDGPFIYGDRNASGALVFGAYAEPEYILSVGNVDQYENDNVMIEVTSWDPNTAVFAIGIDVGDNTAEGGESISVTGVNGFSKNFAMSPSGGGLVGSFIGVVSTVPLRTLFFDEAVGDDDIFIRNPQFRVMAW